jgi:uncharacterized protein (TIRG00374 family)
LVIISKEIAKDPSEFNLANLNFAILALGFFILLLVWLSKAYRILIIARGMGEKISLKHCFQIYLATCFISHITPFNAGGAPLQIYLLHKKGIGIGKATAVTTIDLGLHSIVYIIVLIGILTFNVGLLGRQGLFEQGLLKKGLLVLILIAVFGGLLYYLFRHYWSGKVKSVIGEKGWLNRLRQEYHLFREGSSLLIKTNWSAMIQAVLASSAYWLFYLILAPLILIAMGKRVDIIALIFRQLIFNAALPLIPTPGGSGGSEVLLSYLFRGLTGAQGLGLFIFIWRIYTFYSSLLVGGFCFLRITR